MPVRTIAVCAGSGTSVIGTVDADVHFTGEATHVRIEFVSTLLNPNLSAARSPRSRCCGPDYDTLYVRFRMLPLPYVLTALDL